MPQTFNDFQILIGNFDRLGLLPTAYRVRHYKVTKVNWLWQIEIYKQDLVWRWFWNPEIRYFLVSQPVFMKCLLSALYWTQVFFRLLSFCLNFVQFFFCFWAYMTKSLLRRTFHSMMPTFSLYLSDFTTFSYIHVNKFWQT